VKKLSIAALLVMPALLWGTPASAQQVQGRPQVNGAEFNALADAVATQIRRGEYEAVEVLLERFTKGEERLEDGRWKLAAARFGIRESIGQNWAEAASRVDAWNKAKPKSIGSVLHEYFYWNRYAWDARGAGYAPSVAPEGRNLFRERLEKAGKVLADSKSFASDNPEWYVSYLTYALEAGWSLEDRMRLLAEAIAKQPLYYDLYFAAARGLTPRWGGSFALVAALADEAVRKTEKVDGGAMYARLYWHVQLLEAGSSDIFTHAGASWPLMRKGFDDIRSRYPASRWILNSFAAFACRARDRETFLTLRGQISDKPIYEAWPPNLSYDLCTRIFSVSS
jgi:hypothetical protein